MTNYDGLYDKKYFGEKLFENHFSDNKLGFKVIENGTILPSKSDLGSYKKAGGIVDENGNFISSSFVHGGVDGSYIPEEKIAYDSETVIYLGMFTHVWGHCLTDNIKRIWFLKSDLYREFFKNCKIVYLTLWNGINKSFAKMLEILDINIENLCEIKQPSKFQKIILPDESFFSSSNETYFYTEEYMKTVDKILHFAEKNFIPFKQKKFYFFHGRNQFGEEKIAQYFHSKGYDIIQPEKFSFEEQLNIFFNCESFASSLGSISHNTIFCKNNIEAIFIPRYPVLNSYQKAINQMKNLKVFYIDSTVSALSLAYFGPYCYIISEELLKHFGDTWNGKYSDEDLENFLEYMRKFIEVQKLYGVKFDLKPKTLKYYGKITEKIVNQLMDRQDLVNKFGLTLK